MSSIDQQFVEFIVKSLVSNPDAVSIERRIDEKGVLLELTVDPEDLGRVIGKRGATAQSLRTLLRALGTKNDARYNLKIVDNGEAPVVASDNAGSVAMPISDTQQDQPALSSPVSTNDNDDDDNNSNDDVNDNTAVAPPIDHQADDHADDPNSVVSKTRKELEELDDLDV